MRGKRGRSGARVAINVYEATSEYSNAMITRYMFQLFYEFLVSGAQYFPGAGWRDGAFD